MVRLSVLVSAFDVRWYAGIGPTRRVGRTKAGDNAMKMAFEPSPAWFRKLAESLGDVVFRYRVADPKGTDYVSPQVFAILGRTADDFYDDPALPLKCIHPEDRSLIQRLLRGDAPKVPELPVVRWRHADGRIVSVEFRTAAVIDAEG